MDDKKTPNNHEHLWPPPATRLPVSTEHFNPQYPHQHTSMLSTPVTAQPTTHPHMLYTQEHPHLSVRPQSSSRNLPSDDVTPAASNPTFTNTGFNLPLLEGSEHVLPPILPAKRSFIQEDQNPSAMSTTPDWTSANHQPTPRRRSSRALRSPPTSMSVMISQGAALSHSPYVTVPRTHSRGYTSHQPIQNVRQTGSVMQQPTAPSATQGLGAMVPGTMISPSLHSSGMLSSMQGQDFSRIHAQTPNYNSKQEAIYGTATPDTNSAGLIDPANFRAADVNPTPTFRNQDANQPTTARPPPLPDQVVSGLHTGTISVSNTSAGPSNVSGPIPTPFFGASLVNTSTAPGAGIYGTAGSAGSRSRKVNPCDESFVQAARAGAKAQLSVDSASGEAALETYELGITIVSNSKLYANQRRSNRLLPGGSDSTTAACYMIGGTADSTLSPLLAKISPCDPREERCKAVERVLKDKTRGAICALNGENPREARADNLAAVRICEVVADILVAFSAKKLLESRKVLFQTVSEHEARIRQLERQLERSKRRVKKWRKAAGHEGEDSDEMEREESGGMEDLHRDGTGTDTKR